MTGNQSSYSAAYRFRKQSRLALKYILMILLAIFFRILVLEDWFT